MELLRNNYEMIAQATNKLAAFLLKQGKSENDIIKTLIQFGMFEEQVKSIISVIKTKSK
jgi:hypothetical protein